MHLEHATPRAANLPTPASNAAAGTPASKLPTSPRVTLHLPSIAEQKASIQREEWRLNPRSWMQQRAKAFAWSKQIEIMESVRDNRRTMVPSCHGPGKSFIAGHVVCWWIDIHKPGTAKVITTAPTGDQVKGILWQEISRCHSKAGLPGRLNQTEWWLEICDDNGNVREELIAIGRKPSDHSPHAFQGFHEEAVLVIFDEATGIPPMLWNAAEGLLSNRNCRILAPGNPDDSGSQFAVECAAGNGANVIRISAFVTPNFTDEKVPDDIASKLVSREWVEEKKKKWGVDNPLYQSRVLGLFPKVNKDALIPLAWIVAAQERSLPPGLPNYLGVDVGGGGNESTIAHRQGAVVRIIDNDQDPNTMHLLEKVIGWLKRLDCEVANVDYIGIGKGICDRSKQILERIKNIDAAYKSVATFVRRIVGINVGKPPEFGKDDYVNLRAKGFWRLRGLFERGEIDIDNADEDLQGELANLRYKPVAGKIQIESKKEMLARGVPSPNRADAVMLAMLGDSDDDEDDKGEAVELVWGDEDEYGYDGYA